MRVPPLHPGKLTNEIPINVNNKFLSIFRFNVTGRQSSKSFMQWNPCSPCSVPDHAECENVAVCARDKKILHCDC